MFRPIEGYSCYNIHSNGFVKSLLTGKEMKGTIARNGYLVVNLIADNGKKSTKYLHRLIAEAFIENKENKRTVNHKNGIKTDNSLNNLEWATDSENGKHSYDVLGRVAYMKGREGYLNHNSEEVFQLDLNMNFIKKFDSQRSASRETGISYKAINRCVTGKSKTSGGYIWRKNEEPDN